MTLAGNKAKRLSLVNHVTKTTNIIIIINERDCSAISGQYIALREPTLAHKLETKNYSRLHPRERLANI